MFNLQRLNDLKEIPFVIRQTNKKKNVNILQKIKSIFMFSSIRVQCILSDVGWVKYFYFWSFSSFFSSSSSSLLLQLLQFYWRDNFLSRLALHFHYSHLSIIDDDGLHSSGCLLCVLLSSHHLYLDSGCLFLWHLP